MTRDTNHRAGVFLVFIPYLIYRFIINTIVEIVILWYNYIKNLFEKKDLFLVKVLQYTYIILDNCETINKK